MEALKRVAADAGQSPARFALEWVAGRPGVDSTLMCVSCPEQVTDNVAALKIMLAPEHRATLDVVSAQADPRMPYSRFAPALRQQIVFGGHSATA